jgi:hypothetical protein
VLRHELPDGTWHYDWLIERPDTPGLLTFRVDARPDDPGVTKLEGVRLPDHRAMYLDFEGEIKGGRGRVLRLAKGEARVFSDSEIEAVFGGVTRRWRMEGTKFLVI